MSHLATNISIQNFWHKVNDFFICIMDFI